MRRRLRENPEIPTSSMADVAMLLVAFFALTAVFAQTAGLPARFDAAPEAPPENAQAFAVHALPALPDSIWMGKPWSTALKSMADGVFYALVTGAVFASFWPGAAA